MYRIECKCKEETFRIKLEADFGADPLWCAICGFQLDFEAFKLSDELKNELIDWMSDYGKWIDLENDSLIIGSAELQAKHNLKGEFLKEKISKELGDTYIIEFKPSSSVEWYGRNTK